jgi:hypothetical protein
MDIQCLVVVQLGIIVLIISEGGRGSESSPLLLLKRDPVRRKTGSDALRRAKWCVSECHSSSRSLVVFSDVFHLRIEKGVLASRAGESCSPQTQDGVQLDDGMTLRS